MTETQPAAIQLYSRARKRETVGVESTSDQDLQIWAGRVAWLLEPAAAADMDESDELDLARLFPAPPDESATAAIRSAAREKLRQKLDSKTPKRDIQQIAFAYLLPLWVWDGLRSHALQDRLHAYARNNPRADRQESRARAEVCVQVVEALAATEGMPDPKSYPSWAQDPAIVATILKREARHLAAQSLGPREPLSILGPVCAVLGAQLDGIARFCEQIRATQTGAASNVAHAAALLLQAWATSTMAGADALMRLIQLPDLLQRADAIAQSTGVPHDFLVVSSKLRSSHESLKSALTEYVKAEFTPSPDIDPSIPDTEKKPTTPALLTMPVGSYCLRKLGNHHDALDALQTTFENALNAITEGKVYYSDKEMLVGHWLIRMAKNACITILRERQTAQNWQASIGGSRDETPGAAGPDPMDPGPSTESTALNKAEVDELRAAVEALPLSKQTQKDVMRGYLAGQTPNEIALRLEITPGAVRVHKQRFLSSWRNSGEGMSI